MTLKTHPFTLIEAIITMVLIAIIVPVSIEAVLLCQRVELSAARSQIALDLAENLLNRKLNDPNNELEISNGTFEPEYPDYRWNLNIENWLVADMNQITVTVQYPLQGDWRSVSLSTLKAQ